MCVPAGMLSARPTKKIVATPRKSIARHFPHVVELLFRGTALGSAKMQCMHFTSNAAFKLCTCRIVVGAFPDALSRSSSRLSSGGLR